MLSSFFERKGGCGIFSPESIGFLKLVACANVTSSRSFMGFTNASCIETSLDRIHQTQKSQKAGKTIKISACASSSACRIYHQIKTYRIIQI